MMAVSKNKTILIIAPMFTCPPTNGTLIDIVGRCLFLQSCGWRVIVAACSIDPTHNHENTNPLNSCGGFQVYFFQRQKRFTQEKSANLIRELQQLIDQYRPPIIWCEYADFAALASRLDRQGAKLFFRAHNFELLHSMEKEWEHTLRFLTGGLRGCLESAWRWLKMTRLTLAILRSEWLMQQTADVVFYISPTDMDYMKLLYGGQAKKYWLPAFIEGGVIPVKLRKSTLDVLYNGSDYRNNVNLNGAIVLLDRIIPEIRSRFPGEFRFHFTGKFATELLAKWAADDVVLHDFIKDYHSFIKEMDMACLPTSYGMGCKIKMIEALARGLPVAGFPQAFRGVPHTPGAFLSCSNYTMLVDAIIRLREPAERLSLAEKSRSAYACWRKQGEKILRDTLNQALVSDG
jgi:glycosyltransferase involved in cell wall biosynthesis